MPRTKAKPETREQTEARLQKNTNTRVGEFEDNRSENQWKLADWVHELYIMYRAYWGVETKAKISAMLNNAYCNINHIPWKEKDKDKDYHVFRSTMRRILIVACRDEEAYKKDRNSGKRLGRIWHELMSKKKRTRQEQRIANGEETVEHKMKRLREEAERGKIVNMEEEIVESQPQLKKKEKEETSWTAPPLNANREWRRTFREIAVNDPRLFVATVEDNVPLIFKEDTLDLIRRDLFEKL